MAAADWFEEQGAPPNVGPMAPGTAPAAGTTPWGTSWGPSGPPADVQTGAQGGGQYQPYSDEALQAILHKYDPSDARQAVAEIDRTFGPGIVSLLDHPTKHDKFVTPTGTYDTVVGAGGANPSWGWMREGGAGGGAGGTLGGLSGVGLSPAGQSFTNMLAGSYGAVGPLLGDPMAGRPITDDPSFGFRMSEGAKALERSAAARGTLLTGGAAKAMQRYAQDVASTEYQNSYARRAQEQGNNYARLLGAAQFMSGEQQNQFGRYYQTAGLGLNAAANQQQNASGYAQNIGNTQLGQGNVLAGSTAAQGQAQGELYRALGNAVGQGASQWYNNRNGGTAPVQSPAVNAWRY